jgi:two-component system, NtrC family, C4-dicarboxylate transport response regulator DctD
MSDLPLLEALVIEDEEAVRLATEQTLELGGFTVHACATVQAARAWLRSDFAGIVITDVRLGEANGLDLLAEVTAIDPDLPVIVMTGHGHISMAVQAMRSGAYDFIEKPFASERLLDAALRAQEKRRLVLENRQLKNAWTHNPDLPTLIGQTPAIERLKKTIATLGPTQVDVLINGATGTGKEVVARHLHAASGRKGPFVAINCGALPESVFESEIFGHEAGAFTGAQKRRLGKLEFAQGGTVFLDEIESMPMALQVKLLRVLQERTLERLGGNQSIALDCRIVAASKADLLELSSRGLFREDLYYRISVVSLHLPTLAQRRDDIPLLLAHFVQAAALRYQQDAPVLEHHLLLQWKTREWPGNVRELRNAADRLVLGVVDAANAPQPARLAAIPPALALALPSGSALSEQVDAFERSLIAHALSQTEHNVALAAEHLQLPKKTLYDKIKKYQLGLKA